MARILIVEDERGINEMMRRSLSLNGHECAAAYCGQEAVNLAAKLRPDLVLLDINLPDIDGFGLMNFLGEIPVICVTARDEVRDRVKGLNAGAEDYIVKPFDIEELLARVRVVLRRNRKEEKLYRIGGVLLDLAGRSVTVDGKPAELTQREFCLLAALAENRNVALSRERLISGVWGADYEGDERTVDVHIQRLRRKLGLEEQIKTVFKYGYRLEF